MSQCSGRPETRRWRESIGSRESLLSTVSMLMRPRVSPAAALKAQSTSVGRSRMYAASTPAATSPRLTMYLPSDSPLRYITLTPSVAATSARDAHRHVVPTAMTNAMMASTLAVTGPRTRKIACLIISLLRGVGRWNGSVGESRVPYSRTTMFWLAMYRPTSEASMCMSSATCSGCMIVVGSSSGASVLRRSVAHRPGEMQTTRVPKMASSSRMTSLIAMSAALDAEYVSQPERPLMPAVDATLM